MLVGDNITDDDKLLNSLLADVNLEELDDLLSGYEDVLQACMEGISKAEKRLFSKDYTDDYAFQFSDVESNYRDIAKESKQDL